MTQTLFALATPAGRSAVAVVRLSGPAVAQVVRGLAGGLPAPRRASLRTLRDAAGAPLDRALVLWFPGPASFTGEDSAELHLHGGPAVVEAVSEALLVAGLAPAGPGAFTRRAFENGRLDLDQAEAIADLVDAESGAQARQALRQLEGALGLRYQAWRETLVTALAFLEAVVDFPDEEIPAETLAAARGPLEALGAALDAALIDEGRGRRVREGWRVAVIGRPNAGKSSLFNALIGRAAAIVTAVPGTTRDVVEAPLTLAGYRLLLADTAGVRLTDDPIEAEGVRRARQWAAEADLRLWVADRSADAGLGEEAAVLLRAGDVLIAGKADLAESADWVGALREAQSLGLEVWPFSAMAGEAEAVLARLAARVTGALAGAEFPAVTRARHAVLLREARDHLARALRGLMEPELAAEDVRLAARALERITGRIGAEDVLDRVFASFCIGK